MLIEAVKQCVFLEEIGKRETFGDWRDEGEEEKLVDWGGLTFDLCWDGSATQIVEVEEMVEEDGWMWEGVGNKGGILQGNEEETFVESPFSWNITLWLKNIHLCFCGLLSLYAL